MFLPEQGGCQVGEGARSLSVACQCQFENRTVRQKHKLDFRSFCLFSEIVKHYLKQEITGRSNSVPP
jgi:hypothetical protein